jgi:hypothetical protein
MSKTERPARRRERPAKKQDRGSARKRGAAVDLLGKAGTRHDIAKFHGPALSLARVLEEPPSIVRVNDGDAVRNWLLSVAHWSQRLVPGPFWSQADSAKVPANGPGWHSPVPGLEMALWWMTGTHSAVDRGVLRNEEFAVMTDRAVCVESDSGEPELVATAERCKIAMPLRVLVIRAVRCGRVILDQFGDATMPVVAPQLRAG